MNSKTKIAPVLMALAGLAFFVAGFVDYTRSSTFDFKFLGFGVLFVGLAFFFYRNANK